MTLSVFMAYLAAAERYAPRAIVLDVRREAKRRLVERLAAGRADWQLCFADLARRVENSIEPK